MNDHAKLILIKSVHTLIWIFFNVVIFYMLYAAITNKIDLWLWVGYGLIFLEGLILLAFRSYCPLTLIARNYSDSPKDNFDIYLPNWLAKNNKLIYTLILFVIILITSYQLIKN
jgi:NhaP-type Na+/H+ or K+/H+ antiporter